MLLRFYSQVIFVVFTSNVFHNFHLVLIFIFYCWQTAELKNVANECARQMEEVKSLKDIVSLFAIVYYFSFISNLKAYSLTSWK